jgi:chorismate mutase
MRKLSELRKRIDQIDEQLLQLLNERAELAKANRRDQIARR